MQQNNTVTVSMKSKRNIFLWALYDFANSFTQIAFAVYFAQWVVVDQGIADIHFNLTFVAAALLLLLTVPIVGFLLDTRFRRITGLRISTGLMAVCYSATAVAAILGNGQLALVLFAFGFYAFLLTFTFYTPLLVDIATPENRGRISGFGFAANFAGQIVAVLCLLPFATGLWSLYGSAARAETLLPAVAAFVLFSLPMLIFFREPRKERVDFAMKQEAQKLLSASKLLFAAPGVLLFLLAHFLFFDAILTASNNFSIFLEQVWSVSDAVKSVIMLGIFVTAAVGAMVSGLIADKVGHQRAFMTVVVGWVGIIPALALAPSFSVFVVLTTVMGFWLGASWVLSRTMMSYLAPVGSHNLAFGFFGVIERASSLLGPLVWGLIASGLIEYGPDRYRISLLAMTLFVALAVVTLLHIRSTKTF